MELPSYLKRCDRFPRSVVEDREDNWCTPSRRRHSKCWGRAFELSVSVEALVETGDAPVLFKFLSEDYSGADWDADGVYSGWADQEPYGFEERSKIVWLSDTVFIFAIPFDMSIRKFHEYFDQGACKLYSIKFSGDGFFSDRVCIILQPAVKRVAPACYSEDEINGMDVILRLVPKLSYVEGAEIKVHPQYGRDVAATGFPASPDALKAFVGDQQGARSLRTVCLQNAGLSLEQWNTVTANCKTNVSFQIDYRNEDHGGGHELPEGNRSPLRTEHDHGPIDLDEYIQLECERSAFIEYAVLEYEVHDPIDFEVDIQMDCEGSAFMESAILNHCPAMIELSSLDHASVNKRQILLRAFQSATSLEELHVIARAGTKEIFVLYVDAISRTRGFQKLTVKLDFAHQRLTHADWETFVGAIASHPTLQDVTFSFSNYFLPRDIERDEVLIQMVRKNTVLRKIVVGDLLLDNRDRFYEAVNPVLTLNRFRQVAQSIKQEDDPLRRKQLLAAILFSKTVCERSALRYLLLKENFDMLEQEKVACMRGRAIPSSVEENEITRLASRKRRRSPLQE